MKFYGGGNVSTMCKLEGIDYEKESESGWDMMGLKVNEEGKLDLLKNSMVSRSRISLWMIRGITTILLWTCVVQLMALGEMWGPRLLKGWPSCFISPSDSSLALKLSSDPSKVVLPPKSKFLQIQWQLFLREHF